MFENRVSKEFVYNRNNLFCEANQVKKETEF